MFLLLEDVCIVTRLLSRSLSLILFILKSPLAFAKNQLCVASDRLCDFGVAISRAPPQEVHAGNVALNVSFCPYF